MADAMPGPRFLFLVCALCPLAHLYEPGQELDGDQVPDGVDAEGARGAEHDGHQPGAQQPRGQEHAQVHSLSNNSTGEQLCKNFAIKCWIIQGEMKRKLNFK